MKKETRRLYIIGGLIVGCAVAVLLVGFFWSFQQVFEEHNKAAQLPRPGTVAYEQYVKMASEVENLSIQLKKASNYENEKKYEDAIIEYKKLLTITKDRIFQAQARYGLVSCYEKSRKYSDALKQLNTLLEKNVLATPELLKKKEHLEKLVNEQQIQ